MKRCRPALLVSNCSVALAIFANILISSLVSVNSFSNTISLFSPKRHSVSSSTAFPRSAFGSRNAGNNRAPVSTNLSEEQAAEVFSLIDTDGSGNISESELLEVLRMLDIDANADDVSALFKHLDVDGNREIEFDEFLAWYSSATESAKEETSAVMDALLKRRTVNKFDTTEVPGEVLRRAIEAAIAAPCHRMTEPWRFINLGKNAVGQIAFLNASEIAKTDPEKALKKQARWTKIPGWCVITSKKNDKALIEEEDYAATCCAIQNFMLALWAEGIGTKWTTGPITRTERFAEICEIDLEKEKVVGCIWYGFASGGLASVPSPQRKRTVDDVLSEVP